MSRTKSLLSDTIVLAFGTLGGRLVGILLLPVYTYALSQGEFGSVDLITTSLDLLIPMMTLSVSEAVVRFAMSPAEQSGDVLRTSLLFAAGGGIIMIPFAALASLWWTGLNVGLVTAIVIFQIVAVILGAWARAIGRVRVFAISGLVQALSIGVCNLVFLLGLDLGVPGFLLSLLVGYAMNALVLSVALPTRATIREGTFDRLLLKRMLFFSAPLVPNVVLWWFTSISGRYFIAFTDGIDSVGVYGVASRFPAIVVMVTTVFAQAWQLAANRSADLAEADLGQFYSRVFRTYAAILILTASILVLFLKPLMRIAVSPEFYEAWELVPLLLLGAIFSAFASFYGAIYTAAKNTKGISKTSFMAGLASLVLNALLVPTFGAIGAALSISLCFLGLWLLRVRDSQSTTATTLPSRILLPGMVLLGTQIAIQYSPLGPAWANTLLVLAVLGIALATRRELTEVFTLTKSTIRRRKSKMA